eukprot:gene11743-15714_t
MNFALFLRTFFDIVKFSFRYWYTLYLLVFITSSYETIDGRFSTYESSTSHIINNSNVIRSIDLHAKVQIYSLSLIFKLWSKPHYRSSSYKQDMIDNLKNVAIPGTGLPLSLFCHNYLLCLLFVFFANPIICLIGAINKAIVHHPNHKFNEDFFKAISIYYYNHLYRPDDWFSLWRLNCRLVSYHSQVTKAVGYSQEDKWTFLTSGKDAGVPVTPFNTTSRTLVCKNKNIEGGMGIFFYKNAAHGGDWILQDKLENVDWLAELLPSNAPLSTMRVITTSSWSLSNEYKEKKLVPLFFNENEKKSIQANNYVKIRSTVLRLGRAGASTDHSSVLFDIDIKNNIIKPGTTNAHWYQLGLKKAWDCPLLPNKSYTHHPDSPNPTVTGKSIPQLDEAINIVINAHFTMMADVPIVGWDVAFTPHGIFLLEVNLSCNFFRGSFDMNNYISFVDAYWRDLEKLDKKNKNE